MVRHPLAEKVNRFCREHSLISPSQKVLVALSGGVDSMVLLHLLLGLIGVERVVAMHLNHGIRGEESDRDEGFVREICSGWGVELVVERHNVPEVAKERGLGMEEAARFVRRRALMGAAERSNLHCIATGHNLNDHVETMLVKMVQGTGLRGICGISVKQGPFVRPLLLVTRDEILAYAREFEIPFVEDSTNRDLDYLRNRVRHRVIPELEKGNPSFLQVAQRLSEVAREHLELVDALTEEAWREAGSGEGDSVSLDVEKIIGLHPTLQRLVVARFLKAAFPGHRMGRRHILQVHGLLCSQGEGMVGVPGGTVLRERGRLVAERVALRELCSQESTQDLGRCVLEGPGEYLWHGVRWRVSISPEPVRLEPNRGVVLSAKGVRFPLVLRCREPGDRIYRRGVGHKKVKKIMQEKGIPTAERDTTPLLVDPSDNRVLWVAGLGADPRLCGSEGPWIVVEREE